MHFKHKHITEPTLTLEDTIVKALNDLTHGLKARQNKKGNKEMEALQRLGEILNKIPTTSTPAPTQSRRVMFEATTKPPQEHPPTAPRVTNETPTPRVVNETPIPRVAIVTPTPRVTDTTLTPRVNKYSPRKGRQRRKTHQDELNLRHTYARPKTAEHESSTTNK